jgi:hypothetical protein
MRRFVLLFLGFSVFGWTGSVFTTFNITNSTGFDATEWLVHLTNPTQYASEGFSPDQFNTANPDFLFPADPLPVGVQDEYITLDDYGSGPVPLTQLPLMQSYSLIDGVDPDFTTTPLLGVFSYDPGTGLYTFSLTNASATDLYYDGGLEVDGNLLWTPDASLPLPLLAAGTSTSALATFSYPTSGLVLEYLGGSSLGSCGCLNVESDQFVAVDPTPEPATFVLFGAALAGIMVARRRLRYLTLKPPVE